jgi:(4-O-methyl)-D-glucuronate---lignin esterase
MSRRVRITMAGGAALLLASLGAADTPQDADPLVMQFEQPPHAARPYVWWHWVDGNVTQDGIRRDLEWMHRVGIGGLQVIDVVMGTAALVSPSADYNSAVWKEDLRFAVHTASDLGIDFIVSSVPGFSESGGPWVRPEEGMKKVVWSVTRIEGGHRFAGKLSQPPSVPGPFQDMPINRASLTAGAEPNPPVPHRYQDIGVVAYRIPEAEKSMDDMHVTVTSSGGNAFDPRVLWDGDLQSAVTVPYGADGAAAWLQISLEKPVTIQAVTVSIPSGVALPFISDFSKPIAQLQASVDGMEFFKVSDVRASIDTEQTIALPPVTAHVFRLSLPSPSPKSNPVFFNLPAPTAHQVAEFVLHTVPRTHRAEEKAAYFTSTGFDADAAAVTATGVTGVAVAPNADVVQMSDVVDLTSRMSPDGAIVWTPPRGRWEILRLGYSLEGTTNHPAGPTGTGLEMDKLNPQTVRSNYVRYLDAIGSVVGADEMGGTGVQAMLNDSWEAGCENWTEHLPEEFAARHGYSLLRWLPALTGRIIGDPSSTERFLWDFRQTLGQLLAENHYEVIAAELHRRGMIHYAESHESGNAFVGDGMAVKRYADIPTGAMWAGGLGPQPEWYDSDLRESASVAHLYGRPIVAAESMTALGNWFASTPEQLKPLADRELLDGVNRFMIHTSVHQPVNDAGPGVTHGPFGQWFTRKETWADQAGAWTDYLARSSFLLQQGTFVADVLYFYGEDSNITTLYAAALPPIPRGYNFDFINREALDLLTVQNGRLTTEHGMDYRVLALDPRTRSMSLPVLRKLHDLASAGATLVGGKPAWSPSLSDDTRDFERLATEMWGEGNPGGVHRVGAGRVINEPLAGAFSIVGLAPDFTYDGASQEVLFTHRHSDAAEIYFLSNRENKGIQTELSFRTAGRAPDLWHADSGRIEAITYRVQDGRTVVPISLDPSEAVFVVFRRPSNRAAQQVSVRVRTPLSTIEGPWDQRFADHSRRSTLTSWTSDAEPEIKYFSGTALYTKSIAVPAAWLDRHSRLELDLGSVKNLAEISLNGRKLGVLWHAPFRVDVTDAVQPGTNRLEIRVTNTWVNRLIGDKQPDTLPHAFTTFNPYQANSPLPESGLLGPVRIVRVDESI